MGVNNVTISQGGWVRTGRRCYNSLGWITRAFTQKIPRAPPRLSRWRIASRRDDTRALAYSCEREIHLDTAGLHPGARTARSSVRDERRSRISCPAIAADALVEERPPVRG